MRKRWTSVWVMLLACTLAFAPPNQLSAHSKAERTSPAMGATVETFERIVISFDTPMRITFIALLGPLGPVMVERETGFDPVTEFNALPKGDIPAGAYRVEWRGLSSDGHPMQGAFEFNIDRKP